MKPLCFVLMPFNKKTDAKGRTVDFNAIYYDFIKIAIENAGLEPIRADEELIGGSIHKPMFERLILCEYAIADLTSLNANVFYELGVRHAIKPYTTIPIFAFDAPPPFDLNGERMLPYNLDENGKLVNAEKSIEELTKKIEFCRSKEHKDSPVFQFIDNFEVKHNLTADKTDAFREKAKYDTEIKEKLFNARNDIKDTGKNEELEKNQKTEKIKSIRDTLLSIWDDLKPINEKSIGTVIDLYLSLRDAEAYNDMIELYEQMHQALQGTKMVQEQLGFAYNRINQREKAKEVLQSIIDKKGPDPETNGILGRVYKDEYDENRKTNPLLADGFLEKSIDVYKAGFHADWRDAYPGVNLVTLAELGGETELIEKYLPLVQFSAEQKIKDPNYWDFATLAELKVIEGDYKTSRKFLGKAVACLSKSENWKIKTTLKNFKMISEARNSRGENTNELEQLIKMLNMMV